MGSVLYPTIFGVRIVVDFYFFATDLNRKSFTHGGTSGSSKTNTPIFRRICKKNLKSIRISCVVIEVFYALC